MTITVDIEPKVQAELARRAAAHGRGVEAYVAELIEEALQSPAALNQWSPERIERTLKEMAQFSEKIRDLPDSAFTRDSIYHGHE